MQPLRMWLHVSASHDLTLLRQDYRKEDALLRRLYQLEGAGHVEI